MRKSKYVYFFSLLFTFSLYYFCFIFFSNDIVIKRDIEALVIQNRSNSCGPASLATLLNIQYNKKFSEQDIFDQYDSGQKYSFADIKRVAEALGFKATVFEGSIAALQQLNRYAILHVNNKHFVVLKNINDETVELADPAFGNRTLSLSELSKIWLLRESKQGLSGSFMLVSIPDK